MRKKARNGSENGWKNGSSSSARTKPRFPPLSGRRLVKQKKTIIEIKTLSGDLAIPAVYGMDPQTKQWINPLRIALGLDGTKKKTCSPELVERVCFTATQSLSYQACELISERWGVPITDSTIQRHVCEQGAMIQERRDRKVQEALDPATRHQVVKQAAEECRDEEFSLLIMLDGWMIRERGQDWGLKPPEALGGRVDWREMKTGIVFRLEDLAKTQSGRGVVLRKYYEAYRGDPETFGQRLWALALRKGLYQAKRVYVVADGAIWIWNLVEQRFDTAITQLDFYHASEHLWAVAHALHDDDQEAKAWAEPLVSQLRHGQHQRVVAVLGDTLTALDALSKENRETAETNVAYFEKNKERLNYAENSAHGCPAGSGAIESTCSQLQDRFKRTGQFWTQPGAAHLMTIEIIRRNDEWDDYWGEMVA